MRRFLFIAISVVVLFSAVAAVLFREGFIRFNYPSDKEYPVKGIDISHHQGPINWEELKKENITFIFLKATEGVDFRDPRFRDNLHKATEKGFRVGAYHFYRLCRKGSEQAANFIANVPRGSINLPPVIDLEFGGNCLSDLPPNQVLSEIQEFIRILKAHYGVTPMIYSTNEFYKKYISDHFRECPIWIRSIYSAPELNDNREWTFWQYANRGRVSGIAGLVDLNVFRGGKEEFERMLMAHGSADTLSTAASVEHFLAEANGELRNFRLRQRSAVFPGKLLATADSLRIKSWDKMDIDGNGHTDVLACGLWGDAYNVVAVMNKGDRFETVFLNDDSEEMVVLPLLKQDKSGKKLLLYKVSHDQENPGSRPRIAQTDTLVFGYGSFIEPASVQTAHEPERLRYSSGACFGTCPVFQLAIDFKACSLTYTAIAHNELKGEFKASADSSVCGEIKGLLKHLDFTKLKDRYAVAWTDDQTHETEIVYDGGNVKRISDYGGQGTRGLSTLYERLFELSRSAEWKKK